MFNHIGHNDDVKLAEAINRIRLNIEYQGVVQIFFGQFDVGGVNVQTNDVHFFSLFERRAQLTAATADIQYLGPRLNEAEYLGPGLVGFGFVESIFRVD